MNKQKYLALTIGPVFSTIARAKKMREIWAASYLFSWIMKQVISHLSSEARSELIMPAPETGEDQSSAGKFPDRLIIPYNEKHEKALIDAIDHAKEKIAGEIGKTLKGNVGDEEIKHWIEKYFRFNIIVAEGSIAEIHHLLDVSELQAPLVEVEDFVIDKGKTSFLKEFFSAITKTSFYDEVFGKQHFKSIIEIAAGELKNQNPDKFSKFFYNDSKPDEDLVKDLKSTFKDNFLTRHKYIAIVHADGDGLSKIIQKASDDKKRKEISAALLSFSSDTVELINRYGGFPIYAGGDDLLFFAPLNSIKGNIFSLTTKLRELYENIKVLETNSTLSFGISFTYYKYPMQEAIEMSRALLFDDAKNEPKNATALQVIKHSGQSFKWVLNHNTASYSAFSKLLDHSLSKVEAGTPEWLNSITPKILDNRIILNEVAKHGKDRIEPFIRNNFDESIHKKEPVKSFLEKFGELAVNLCAEIGEKSTEEGADIPPPGTPWIDYLHALYRTIHFMKRKDNE